jgi:hypothetical protein
MQVRIKFTTVNTGACTINLNSLGAKSIKLLDGTDPLDGDISAGKTYTLSYDGTNFVLQSVAIRSTDAIAITGTDILRFITPKQAKDNYLLLTKNIAISRDDNVASGTVTYTHGLGRIPKNISVSFVRSSDTALRSDGGYDGSGNSCLYSWYNSGHV